jgi:hypothetical protein
LIDERGARLNNAMSEAPTVEQNETEKTAENNGISAEMVDAVDVGKFPDVNERAIEAELARGDDDDDAAPPPTAPAANAGPVDRYGRAFDPAVHEHDGGVPRLGKSKKKGGAPLLKIKRGGDMKSYVAPKRASAAPVRDAQPNGAGGAPAGGDQEGLPDASGGGLGDDAPPTDQPVNYREVAQSWLEPALDLVTARYGEEWRFDDERRERYFRVGEKIAIAWDVKTELAPEWQLLGLMVGDFAKRAHLPQTKERTQVFVGKWKRRLSSFWGWITGRPPEAPADEANPPKPEPTNGYGPVRQF